MNKVLKFAGIAVASLVGIVIVAFVILKLISDDQYKAWITSGVQSATGRDFSMQTLELDFNTSLTVDAKGIRMANADWSDQPDMLTVDRLAAEVDLVSLLGGVAEIRTVIEKADILAQTNPEGASNWALAPTPDTGEREKTDREADSDGGGLPLRPLIREFRIQDSTVTVIDGKGGEKQKATINNLLLETPEAELTLALSARFAGKSIEMTGNLGRLDKVLDDGSSPININGKIDQNSLIVSGTWGPLLPDPNMDLNLSADVPSTSKLAAIAGLDLAELGIVKLTTELSAKNGHFSIARIATNLDGEVAAASIKGSIENLSDLDGMELSVEANTSVLAGLMEQLNVDIPVPLPPDVKVNAQIRGGLEALEVKDFTAQIRDEGVDIEITGSVNHALAAEGIDAAFTVKAESTSTLSKYAKLEVPSLGTLDISGKIISFDKAIRLAGLTANLNSDNINLQVTGEVDDLVAVSGINAAVQANISSLTERNLSEISALLKQFNVELPLDLLPKSAKLGAQVSGDLNQLAVNDIDVEVLDEAIQVTLKGKVANALAPEGIDAVLGFKSDSTAALSKYAQMELPELGALAISGRVLSKDKIFSLDDLSAVLNSDNINLQITGGVNDLIAIEGVDAGVGLDIDSFSEQNIADLEQLLTQYEIEAPLDLLPASAKLSAKVSGGLEQLGVTDINVQIRDEGTLVTLTGAVANALTPEGVDARLTFRSETLSALSKYTGMDLPETGALNISGQVLSKDQTYGLENLVAELDAEDFNITLAASMGDILAVQGVNAELTATVNSLASLSEIVQTELPQTDPVTLHAIAISNGEGENKTATVSVKAASGGATLVADSKLSDLIAADYIEASLTVDATSLSDFNKFAQTELPEKGPFSLTGTIHAQPNEFNLDDFQLSLDEQALNGKLGIKLAENETELSTLKGELNIPYLDLSPFLIAKPTQEPAPDPAGAETTTTPATRDVKEDQELVENVEEAEEVEKVASDRLFSTDPLPLDQLRNFDADFSVTADRLKLGKADMTDLSVVMSLKEGLLSVDPIKGIAGPGTIDGNVKLDGSSDSAILAVDITLDNIPMPHLGGGLDLNIELDGQGESVAAIMGGLDGQIVLVVRDGRIEQSFATSFGSGLFSFSGGKDYTDLECGILRVDIKDGKADFENTLAAQLTDVTWRGGGEINLKTEKLDAGIAPKPRKGIPIGTGGMASLFHVGGTLKNPRVQLDPKDVAKKYGKYMAYISTGGLSLLAEATINKLQANVDVCEQILAGTVFDEDPEGKQSEKEAPVPKNLQ